MNNTNSKKFEIEPEEKSLLLDENEILSDQDFEQRPHSLRDDAPTQDPIWKPASVSREIAEWEVHPAESELNKSFSIPKSQKHKECIAKVVAYCSIALLGGSIFFVGVYQVLLK